MPKNERKLKILPKHFSRRWKEVVFPEIRLAGKWLNDLGFTCGRSVTVTLDESTIIIKMLPEVKLQPIVQKPKRKEGPQLPPELQNVSNYELMNVYGDEYRKHIEAVKQWKRDKKENARNRRVKKSVTGFKSTFSDDAQIIPLHPEANQAAEGCNFDTIA